MFTKETYIERRKRFRERFDSGLLFFPGNGESPMNYPANTFTFRQDSNFLYFWGLDYPDLGAIIDVDSGDECVYGTDYGVDDIIWMGPQETMAEKSDRIGATKSGSLKDLEEKLRDAVHKKRKIHYLPPYSGETTLQISNWLQIPHTDVKKGASEDMIRAVVSLRSIKSGEEIEQMEMAHAISHEMYKLAMRISNPGRYEYEVFGAVEGLALAQGSHLVPFPVICTIHGEVFHGHEHGNLMKEGDLLVLDSGAESPLHYASDITRTIPVSGKFSGLQKDIYEIVLAANEKAIEMIRPGVPYRDVHLEAAKIVADGMKSLGFIKGSSEDAVAAGAHALFFPHGLGHMIGLDVHDMEGLGEDYVGYDDEFKRSDQFGFAYLRLGKKLQRGFVITVEPGIYFVPELIDLWHSQSKFTEFIDYDAVVKQKGFGGIRIEDDVEVTEQGHRVLGKPIAKTAEDVESWCSA